MREASADSQYAAHEGVDPVELELADRRVPDRGPRCAGRPGGAGRREVDLLERAVDGVTDLGRVQPACAARREPQGTGFIPATRSA